LVTFPTITDALDWVVEFQQHIESAVASGELPLRVRVGVHAGETIADMGDVFGTAVNLAARVVDKADAGEVLVTDTVRQIAVGGRHTFSSLGKVELKGIPEAIGLHRLEWQP
jgi:class 3 adenylate cyclase